MKVLVDTSVWSLAFRKNVKNERESGIIEVLSELVRDTRVVIIGPIRQEILSGIADRSVFENLKAKLAIFRDHEIRTEDYEQAAWLYNICRSKGVQGSHNDYLICSVSMNYNLPILTLDKDFLKFKELIPIKTMKIESV